MRILLAFLALGAALRARAGDEKILPPYPGSTPIQNENVGHQSFEVPLGPVKDGKLSKTQVLEGTLTKLQYASPGGKSALEVFRNYEAAVAKAGFKTLYACRGEDARASMEPCGSQIGFPSLGYWPTGTSHYFAARKTHKGREIWLVVDVQGANQKMWVMRPKPMELGKVKVDAAALGQGLEEEGHVAVYGIRFDTDKAELQPSSEPILAEIAKLLKASPRLAIYVVGHTDNQGSREHNMSLSQRRAGAVVKALVERHGIAEGRLAPEGVGPLVPLASNGSEEGRAKNRRVDLVAR